MKKITKKAFSKQLIWKIYVPLLIVIIGIILDRCIPNINLIRVCVGFIIKIITLKYPVYVFMILIVLIIIVSKIFSRRLNNRQQFLLSLIDDREIGLTKLFIAYKKMFPNDSRTMTECCKELNKLEKQKIIKLGCQTGGISKIQDELFELSKRGKRKLNNISEELKEKTEKVFEEVYRKDSERGNIKTVVKEEDRKEIVYILGIIANQLDKRRMKSVLRNDYFSEYRDKEISKFNYIWSILEREQFIVEDRGITGYGGGYSELPFYITDKGLEFYNEQKTILKMRS